MHPRPHKVTIPSGFKKFFPIEFNNSSKLLIINHYPIYFTAPFAAASITATTAFG